jgi:hypothetical protein
MVPVGLMVAIVPEHGSANGSGRHGLFPLKKADTGVRHDDRLSMPLSGAIGSILLIK